MREEMRAEKREKRQRKSVIYYYIAIVITAFFGTGLSLYLQFYCIVKHKKESGRLLV